MTTITAPTGSLIIQAFERAWDAIQTLNPDVPNVVFITGGGVVATRGGIAVKWGHFGANHWDTHDGAAHELFVSGESLSRPAHETMQTLLHEAAHALAHVRGIKDTSRRNKYHNKRFVTLATELGLEWADGRTPDTSIGFSDVRITSETMLTYASTIARLEDDRVAWRDMMGFTLPGGDGDADGQDDDADGQDGDGEGSSKPRSRNTKPKAVCECETDNSIWLSRKTLETKRPMCGVCMSPYTLHPDYV